MSKIIYTCITGGYDTLNEIATSHRAICFTDQEITSATWEIIRIANRGKVFRDIKIRPDKFLPHHEQSIWIDGNLVPNDVDSLIAEKKGFWCMSHPRRNCIYDEAARCIEIGKDHADIIQPQIARYVQEGYPVNNGLVATGFLIRCRSEFNSAFAERWWKEVENHSIRDQISFNYCAWKTGLQYQTFPFLRNMVKAKHNIITIPSKHAVL